MFHPEGALVLSRGRPGRARRQLVGSLVLSGILGTPLAGPGLRGQETGSNEVVDPTTLPRPTTHAVRTSGEITIDGRRDESEWSQAPAITQFMQAKPQPGRPATEATDVRLLYDEEFLYISAICYDSAPGEEVVNTLERDSNTLDTDVFGVALDTFRDRRNSFAFFVNPRGAIRDGQTFNDSRTSNFSWNAAMKVETFMREDGWSVEMAIPWNTLRFDPSQEDQIWGVNFLRRARRKSEDSYWAPLGRHEVLYTMSSAGTLLGLKGIAPGRNLKVKPYVIGSQSKGVRLADGEDGRDFDRGIDVKYGLTTGLTLDLTYNTDFSQVEVDQERVNLTRFSLFFPEKRDFFLENSGIFDFGDVTERGYRMGASLGDFTLFHSRRIGLTQSGLPL
ncbi:MAG: DUF5916 domain-containing protein, partial [Longimicrobiales bacterium]|nr:DUF5916 domain-containing protein [Longimicrobiales bacterium]